MEYLILCSDDLPAWDPCAPACDVSVPIATAPFQVRPVEGGCVSPRDSATSNNSYLTESSQHKCHHGQ